MIILYILIILLVIAVLLLALALYYLAKHGAYISDKEKEFIIFVIDIFIEYGDDLGIQSKNQHKKLVEELNKIKTKHLKTKKDDKTGNADGKV
jgi:competence protein ComGC